MLRRKSSKDKKTTAHQAKKEKTPKAKKSKAVKKPKVRAGEGVIVAKPGFDIYTTMLLVSLLSLCLACIVLGLELQRFSR